MSVDSPGSVPLDKLSLRGAMILYFSVEPLKTIVLRLFTFPEHAEDRRGGREYQLQFAKVAGFRCTSFHIPAKVQAHSVMSEQAFVNESLQLLSRSRANIQPASLRHFQIITDTGQLDVVSETAVCLPIWDALTR